MRVLMTSTPGPGHVLPMVPIARALQAAGHQVIWATGPDAHRLISAAGLDVVASGTDQATRTQRFRAGWPQAGALAPRERRALMFPVLFATLSAQLMHSDLRAAIDEHRPDLIVHEPCEFAAAPLAHGLGIPHATVGFGRLLPPRLLAGATDEVADLWDSSGSAAPDDLGLYDHVYLHPLPASLEPVTPGGTVHLVRPLSYDGSDEPITAGPDEIARRCTSPSAPSSEPWLRGRRSSSRSGHSMSTRCSRSVAPWTRRHSGHSRPGSGSNGGSPKRRALAGSDLVVSHGGSGAMIGVASTGLPHLMLPMAADHFENADMIGGRGLGAVLEPPDVSAEAVASGIAQLLDDDDVRARAEVTATEIAAMPGPDDAVGLLEQLVTGRRASG
jgi:hypothetical protein